MRELPRAELVSWKGVVISRCISPRLTDICLCRLDANLNRDVAWRAWLWWKEPELKTADGLKGCALMTALSMFVNILYHLRQTATQRRLDNLCATAVQSRSKSPRCRIVDRGCPALTLLPPAVPSTELSLLVTTPLSSHLLIFVLIFDTFH